MNLKLKKIVSPALIVITSIVLFISLSTQKTTVVSPFNSFQEMCFAELKIPSTQSKENLCNKVNELVFKKSGPVQNVEPSDYKALAYPIDEKVKILAFQNPKAFADFSYCYFNFRKWFDPKQIDVNKFITAASGFAILKKELKGYSAWLLTEEGKACSKSVTSVTNSKALDLETYIGNKDSLLGLNPLATLKRTDNLDYIYADIVLTLNHERIHVLHLNCPALNEKAIRDWDASSKKERQELATQFSGYNWNDQEIAQREYLALRFEKDPRELIQIYQNNCLGFVKTH